MSRGESTWGRIDSGDAREGWAPWTLQHPSCWRPRAILRTAGKVAQAPPSLPAGGWWLLYCRGMAKSGWQKSDKLLAEWFIPEAIVSQNEACKGLGKALELNKQWKKWWKTAEVLWRPDGLEARGERDRAACWEGHLQTWEIRMMALLSVEWQLFQKKNERWDCHCWVKSAISIMLTSPRIYPFFSTIAPFCSLGINCPFIHAESHSSIPGHNPRCARWPLLDFSETWKCPSRNTLSQGPSA